jgi:hypothetical protein
MAEGDAPNQFEGQPITPGIVEAPTEGLSLSRSPNRGWTAKWGEHERLLLQTQTQAEIDRENAKHHRDEQVKDNDQRRNITYGIVALLIATYIFTGIVAVWSENPDTRDRAWDVGNSLIGALLGAIAGYFAGDRKSKN